MKAVSVGVIKAAVSQAKMKRGAKAAIIAVSIAGKMITLRTKELIVDYHIMG